MNSLHYSTVKWPTKKKHVPNNNINTINPKSKLVRERDVATESIPEYGMQAKYSSSVTASSTASPQLPPVNIVPNQTPSIIVSGEIQNKIIVTNRRNGYIVKSDKKTCVEEIVQDLLTKIYPQSVNFNSLFCETKQRTEPSQENSVDPFCKYNSDTTQIPSINDLFHDLNPIVESGQTVETDPFHIYNSDTAQIPSINDLFHDLNPIIEHGQTVDTDPFHTCISDSMQVPSINDLFHGTLKNINLLPEQIDMSFKMIIHHANKQTDLKIAVVTAMFLIDFDIMDDCGSFCKIEGFDYFLFTNDKEKCCQMYDLSEWNIIELDTQFVSGVHATKHVKWLTHVYLPEYDNIIWVDSHISPNHECIDEIMKIIDLVNQIDTCPIYTRTQYLNNVGVDIEWCINNNRMNMDMKQSVIEYLVQNDYDVKQPDQTYWTNAIIKNNKNQRLIDLSVELFKLIISVGHRDQHWLPFLLQKYQLTASIIHDYSLFRVTGQSNETNHDYVSNNISINMQTKILLIQQTGDYHYEIIESLIVKHEQIVGLNNVTSIYLNSIGQHNNRSFIDYIIKKYPYVRIGIPTTYDYYINSTIYPQHYDNIKDQDTTTHFYISHRVDESVYNNAPNIFYLTPLSSYNLFYANVLPFSNNNDIKNVVQIPIYVVQGAIDGSRRNYKLLEKILSQPYEYEFKFKIVGRGSLPDQLIHYKDKIEVLSDLNFIDYHKSFADCYCILPLITKNTHPQYYSDKVTSTINYARGYKLKCLIDQDLQDIYQLHNVEIFQDENDICRAFEKTLTDFYNFSDRTIT